MVPTLLKIAPVHLLQPLKETAIDLDRKLSGHDQIAQSGHSLGRAMKLRKKRAESRHLIISLPLRIKVSAKSHHLMPFAFDLEIAHCSQCCLIDNPDLWLGP